MEIALIAGIIIGIVLLVDNYRMRGRLECKEQSNELLRQRVEALSRRIVMMDTPSPVDDTGMAFVKHLSALARKHNYDVLESDTLDVSD